MHAINVQPKYMSRKSKTEKLFISFLQIFFYKLWRLICTLSLPKLLLYKIKISPFLQVMQDDLYFAVVASYKMHNQFFWDKITLSSWVCVAPSQVNWSRLRSLAGSSERASIGRRSKISSRVPRATTMRSSLWQCSPPPCLLDPIPELILKYNT